MFPRAAPTGPTRPVLPSASPVQNWSVALYRKAEIKMRKINYPDILPDTSPEEMTADNVFSYIDHLMEDYRSVDKTDFLKIYLIIETQIISMGMED